MSPALLQYRVRSLKLFPLGLTCNLADRKQVEIVPHLRFKDPSETWITFERILGAAKNVGWLSPATAEIIECFSSKINTPVCWKEHGVHGASITLQRSKQKMTDPIREMFRPRASVGWISAASREIIESFSSRITSPPCLEQLRSHCASIVLQKSKENVHKTVWKY
jgi:hypothetical protein